MRVRLSPAPHLLHSYAIFTLFSSKSFIFISMYPEGPIFTETRHPSPTTVEEMKKLSQRIKQSVHDPYNPSLLARNYETLMLLHTYDPFPIQFTPNVISVDGNPQQSLTIEYWVDGNPKAAAGIMQRRSITLYKDEEGVGAYTSSKPLDPHMPVTMTSNTNRAFRKQAEKLYKAIGEAIEHSQPQLLPLYQTRAYPTQQLFTTHRLFRELATFIDHPSSHILSPMFLRRNLTKFFNERSPSSRKIA